MPSRENKDTATQYDKRVQASKKVNLRFTHESFTHFQTLNDEGISTHEGKIDPDNPLNDTCDCDSFLYGMEFFRVSEDSEKIESRYVNEHGEVFQCKHIIRAKYFRSFRPKEIVS